MGLVTEYEGLWDPIAGATDGHGSIATPTPELQLQRTFKLKEAYAELKSDLLEELALIDSRIITPTTDARDCITPLRKTIKKRENKRVDYEQAQDKASKLQRKIGRTPKDDKALAKIEDDMARAADVRYPSLCSLRSQIAHEFTSAGIQCCRRPFEGDTPSVGNSNVQYNSTALDRHGAFPE